MQLTFFSPQLTDMFPHGQWIGRGQYFVQGDLERSTQDLDQLKARFLFVCPLFVYCHPKVGENEYELTYVLQNPESMIKLYYRFSVFAHSWIPPQSISFPCFAFFEEKIQSQFPINFKGSRPVHVFSGELPPLPMDAGVHVSRGLEWKTLSGGIAQGGDYQVQALCAGENIWRLQLGDRSRLLGAKEFSYNWYLSLHEFFEKQLDLEVAEKTQLWRVMFAEFERIESHLSFLNQINLCIEKKERLFNLQERSAQISELIRMYFGNQCRGQILCLSGLNRFPDKGWEVLALKIIKSLYLDIELFLEFLDNKVRKHQDFSNDISIRGEWALNWGLTGPNLRATGIKIDWRTENELYNLLDHRVALGINGTTFDRIWVRAWEVKESTSHCGKILDWLLKTKGEDEKSSVVSVDSLAALPSSAIATIDLVEGECSFVYQLNQNKVLIESISMPQNLCVHAITEWGRGLSYRFFSKWFESFNLNSLNSGHLHKPIEITLK